MLDWLLTRHHQKAVSLPEHDDLKVDAQAAMDELRRTLTALSIEVGVVRKDRRRRQEPTPHRRRVDDV